MSINFKNKKINKISLSLSLSPPISSSFRLDDRWTRSRGKRVYPLAWISKTTYKRADGEVEVNVMPRSRLRSSRGDDSSLILMRVNWLCGLFSRGGREGEGARKDCPPHSLCKFSLSLALRFKIEIPPPQGVSRGEEHYFGVRTERQSSVRVSIVRREFKFSDVDFLIHLFIRYIYLLCF